MTLRPVSSSNVAMTGYDEARREAGVVFKSSPGQVYVYEGVSPESWGEIQSAPSVGTAVGAVLVRPKLKFRKEPLDRHEVSG